MATAGFELTTSWTRSWSKSSKWWLRPLGYLAPLSLKYSNKYLFNDFESMLLQKLDIKRIKKCKDLFQWQENDKLDKIKYYPNWLNFKRWQLLLLLLFFFSYSSIYTMRGLPTYNIIVLIVTLLPGSDGLGLHLPGSPQRRFML